MRQVATPPESSRFVPLLPLKFDKEAPGLRCAAATDVGMRRRTNQDSLAVVLAESAKSWRERGHLFVVADGMGAHAAGELASKIATDNIPLSYHKWRDREPSEAIVAAVEDANERIYRKGQDSVDFYGMGTTCCCLLLLPTGALTAHVGDSRIYRLRGPVLEQLTFDHSLVWEMGAANQASDEEVPPFVPRNIITRSLGPHPQVQVDVEGPFHIVPGDRFLLCSDGLTGPLNAELIGLVVATLPPREAAQTLVDLANLLGGPDNISVIVVEAKDLWRIEATRPAGGLTETVELGSPHQGFMWRTALGWWGAAALGGVAAAGLAATYPAWALACGGAAAGLAWQGLRAGRPTGEGLIRASSAPRGKAPYRRYEVGASSQMLDVLGDIVRQIEDLEAQKEWGFDWTAIHDDRAQAHAAIGRGDFTGGVTAYCSAVRRLMAALRDSQERGTSDSTINLDEE